MDVVLLFPGQGSQKPGMGKDLADAFPAARAVFEAVDKALGLSLSHLCFSGPMEELTLTQNAQPALLAHGAAAWAVLEQSAGIRVCAAGGHSLGEFTAYHAAGALSVEDAARLVRRRGELMYRAGIERPGAMAAVLGEPSTPIETVCERASREAGLVVPANYNSPGQVVISGESAGVDRAMVLLREAGAKRTIKLNVSGAFHSPLMATAAPGLEAALNEVAFAGPRFPVYANVDASPVTDSRTARKRLLDQLSKPVRWTEEVTAMAAKYPDALYLELGPGNVLGGLVKKICPSVRTASCGTVADVSNVKALLAA
jgi:[acyl-carrier-protein] S-malonyltransferase